MRYLIVIGASLAVLAASAIEAPKPEKPATTPAPAEQPADQPPEQPAAPAPDKDGPPAAAESEEEKLPPLPADTMPAGPPPARFTPTEKVRADFPVSFPIDI